MSVHRTPSGFVVRWREGSRQRSRTFRKSDGFTREDAERFDHSVKRRKRMGGIDPLASERDFAEVVNEWWKGHESTVSHMTRTNQKGYLERIILPRFEGQRLCDITTPELEAFRQDLTQGPPTQRKILFLLSAVFTYAQRMGYATHNPMSVVRKPPAPRTRLIQPFPPERVEALREWFLRRGDIESATLVSVLAYAGPRPSEAFAHLTWADVGKSTLIFRGEKTGKDRTTRLLSPLAHDLSGLSEGDRAGNSQPLTRGSRKGVETVDPLAESNVTRLPTGPVFGWSDSRFNNWRKRRFGTATKELRIENTRPYDLRHAFASLLAAEGREIGYIARQMGHSIATCERWYRHLIEDVERPEDAEKRIWTVRRQQEGAWCEQHRN